MGTSRPPVLAPAPAPSAGLSSRADRLTAQASATGHLNTIMTLYEIVEPPVPSPLSGVPLPVLRRAIAVLARSARAQTIAVADGEGVRFLAGAPTR